MPPKPADDSDSDWSDVGPTVWTSSLLRWLRLVQDVCVMQTLRLLFSRAGKIRKYIKARAIQELCRETEWSHEDEQDKCKLEATGSIDTQRKGWKMDGPNEDEVPLNLRMLRL